MFKAPKGTPMDAFNDPPGDCGSMWGSQGIQFVCTRPAGHPDGHVAVAGPDPETDWCCCWTQAEGS